MANQTRNIAYNSYFKTALDNYLSELGTSYDQLISDQLISTGSDDYGSVQAQQNLLENLSFDDFYESFENAQDEEALKYDEEVVYFGGGNTKKEFESRFNSLKTKAESLLSELSNLESNLDESVLSGYNSVGGSQTVSELSDVLAGKRQDYFDVGSNYSTTDPTTTESTTTKSTTPKWIDKATSDISDLTSSESRKRAFGG